MTATERTLCIFKPDLAVNLRHVAQALIQILALELTPVHLCRLTMTRAQATQLYRAHVGQPYFDGNIEFVTSGPSYLIVLEGERACSQLRDAIGATDPARAQPGTLRAMFGTGLPQNAVHGSETPAAAALEITIFFQGEGRR